MGLLRGDPQNVTAAFGPYLARLRVRSIGRWFLIERLPGVDETDISAGAGRSGAAGEEGSGRNRPSARFPAN